MSTNTTNIEFNIATGALSGATTIVGPLAQTIRGIRRRTEDLTGFFDKVADDFYKTNNTIVFSDTGVKFKDLTYKRKATKRRAIGSAYPILVGETGALRESLTNRASSNASVNISKKSMLIRSLVTYSGFHQTGASGINMPKRPPIQLDGRIYPDVEMRNRRWMKIASDWSMKEV